MKDNVWKQLLSNAYKVDAICTINYMEYCKKLLCIFNHEGHGFEIGEIILQVEYQLWSNRLVYDFTQKNEPFECDFFLHRGC